MTVAIVVDGAAALPADLIELHSIGVVPMNLIVDGTGRPDTDVSQDELLALLDTSDVTTSGPSPGQWVDGITEAARADGIDAVLVLTVSAEMSTTLDSAEIAATMVDVPTRVVDTRSAAGGEGLVAIAAARLAATGAPLDEVVGRCETVIEQVHLAATLDSLAHLVRSGRVPNLAAMAAHWLHVNPMFEFRQGAAHALHPAMGHEAAAQRIVHRCVASRPHDAPGAKLHVVALDAHAPERARLMLEAVVEEVPDADWFLGSFGPVMLVHVGPGVAGLAWWWET